MAQSSESYVFALFVRPEQPWTEAVSTFEAMASTYESLNYEIVLLPLASVKERAAFVLRQAAKR